MGLDARLGDITCVCSAMGLRLILRLFNSVFSLVKLSRRLLRFELQEAQDEMLGRVGYDWLNLYRDVVGKSIF